MTKFAGFMSVFTEIWTVVVFALFVVGLLPFENALAIFAFFGVLTLFDIRRSVDKREAAVVLRDPARAFVHG